MPQVLVIIGSIRPHRVGPSIAAWVAEAARATLDATIELVDLRDWHLPLDDEPGLPAKGVYVQRHTRAWSAKIAAADAFVFVSCQYNWGYPAALKNAIDHLYGEWQEKPAAIVTYGGHGGGKCAAQLRGVLNAFDMRIAETMPALTLPPGQVEGNAGAIDAETVFADDRPTVVAAMRELGVLLAAGR